ncbi:efflux RND transporter permease subunit [Cohnella faecalis]
MSLLRGGLQAFLLPFALTVTYALLSSLIVALTVIPAKLSRVLKNSKIKEHLPSKRFTSFLEWNLRFKWLPILIAFLLLLGSVGTYFSLPKERSTIPALAVSVLRSTISRIRRSMKCAKTDSSSKSF